MKRLWKNIIPCMSDIEGFCHVLNMTNGLGIVDDSSRYKHPKIISTHIKEKDVITGTKEKILSAIKEGLEYYNPKFILIAQAPCASMISADFEEIKHIVKQTYKIDIEIVKIDGTKDYLFGMYKTLEALEKLYHEKVYNYVNIESINNIAFYKFAKYMKEKYNIDYEINYEIDEEIIDQIKRPKEEKIIIIGEQITSNGYRLKLKEKGYNNVSIYSFYEMDESLKIEGDKKILHEDDIVNIFNTNQNLTIIGDKKNFIKESENLTFIEVEDKYTLKGERRHETNRHIWQRWNWKEYYNTKLSCSFK